MDGEADADNDDGSDGINFDQPDALLKSAYRASLDLALQSRIEAVCFSLLSAGTYRGDRGQYRASKRGSE